MSKTYTFEEILLTIGYLVYTNVGTSMVPLLRQRRDIIEIRRKDPATRCKRYDVVLYKRGDKYILHRVLKVRPNDYIICGDHNIWREYGITDAQILGVMTRVIRNGKSITPDNFGYKFYVHLWCDFYHVRAGILVAIQITRRLGHGVKKVLHMDKQRNEKTEEDG